LVFSLESFLQDQLVERQFGHRSALAVMRLLALTVGDVVLIVALFLVGELLLSRLFFKMHLRDQPY
jgi:CDP-2,3-bis-(O-geranylgeranyl)-sn-glycerol synthase